MDVDGRVLRFDSFSKVLSSGLRVGLVSGPQALVERIDLHTQASNLHASGLSQAAILALFEHWGVGTGPDTGLGRLDDHIEVVTKFYKDQCERFLLALDGHLRGTCSHCGRAACKL